MKELKDIDVMELIIPQLVDRSGRLYIQNEEYIKAFEKQEQVFNKLYDLLTNKKQKEALERYVEKTNRIGEVVERLVYIQGMKDMFSLIAGLQTE